MVPDLSDLRHLPSAGAQLCQFEVSLSLLQRVTGVNYGAVHGK